eukprot:1349634-Amphidinium_carterae.1
MDVDEWSVVAACQDCGVATATTQEAASDDWADVAATHSVSSASPTGAEWTSVAADMDIVAVQAADDGADSDIDVGSGICLPAVAAKRRRGRPRKNNVFVAADSSGMQVCDAGVSAGADGSSSGTLGLEVVHTSNQHGALDASAARIDPLCLQAAVPRHHQGFALLPIPATALQYCKKMANGGEHEGTEYRKLERSFLESGSSFHLCSGLVRSVLIDVERRALAQKLIRLASAQFVESKVHRFMLEKSIVESNHIAELIGYSESMAWDETPLKACARFSDMKLSMHEGSALRGIGTSFGAASTIARLQSSIRADPMICKVLQTQFGYGMVMQLRDGKFLKVVGQQPTCLQVLGKTTAKVLKEALSRASGASPWSKQFQLQCLVSACDKAGYNGPAVHAVADARPCSVLELTCEVHDTSRAFNGTFESLMATDITGLIACALTLRGAGMFALFRQAMREEISSRLQILHGVISEDAKQHKLRVMRVMYGGGSKSLSQMVLLAYLPNGDWRSHHIEHLLPASSSGSYDKSGIASTMEEGICQALVGRRPKVWPRHRWTGSEIATEELTLMECIHKLLSTSYVRFLKKMKAPQPLPQTHGDKPYADCLDLNLSSNVDQQSDVLGAQATLMDEQLGEADVLGDSGGDIGDYAKQNDAYRQKAQAWLADGPTDRLCLCRMAMEPLRHLLQSQFEVCSSDWELQQRAAVAKDIMDGVADEGQGVGCQRQFMATIAAEKVLENSYFAELQVLWQDQDVWLLISERSKTIAFNNLAFRVLGRQGGLIQSTIGDAHDSFPLLVFTLLKDPSKGPSLSEQPKCLMDEFSQWLLAKFPNFAGKSCLQFLQLEAILASTSIARLESLHASIRRQLVAASTQTWCQQMSQLSATWLLQNMRTSRSHMHACKPGKANALVSRGKVQGIPLANNVLICALDAQVRKPCKRGTSPGPWRAFVRIRSAGMRGRPNLATLATEYKAAKASGVGMGEVQTLSKAASIARACSAPSKQSIFGVRGRDLQRLVLKQRRYSLWLRTQKQTPIQKAAAIAEKASETGDLDGALSTVSRLEFLDGAARRQRRREHVSVLQRFQELYGQSTVDLLKQTFSGHDWGRDHLCLLPDKEGLSVFMPGVANEETASALDWANEKKHTNVLQALEKQWSAAHEVLEESSCNDVAVASRKHALCKQLRLCVCSDAGRELLKFRNRLLVVMKALFKAKETKQRLTQGFMVLQLRLIQPCLHEHSPSREETLWMHISSMSLSPYKPVFHVLQQTYDDTGFWGAAAERILLQWNALFGWLCGYANIPVCPHMFFTPKALMATLQFVTDIHGFRKVCLKCHWSLAWWEIESHDMPLPQLHPQVVTVVPFRGGEFADFWPVKRAARKRQAPSATGASSFADTLPAPIPELDMENGDALDDAALTLADDQMDDDITEDAEMMEQAAALEYLMSEPVPSVPKNTQKSKKKSDAAIVETPSVPIEQEELPLQQAEPEPSGVAESSQPPRAERVATRLQIGNAAAAVFLGGTECYGKISFYEKKSAFEAVCFKHKDCNMARVNKARKCKPGQVPVAGRPVGFLARWLADHTKPSKASHKDESLLMSYTHEERLAAREELEKTNA